MIQPIIAGVLRASEKQSKNVVKDLSDFVWVSSVLPKLELTEVKPYEYLSPSKVIAQAFPPENVGQKIDFFAF